MAEPFEVLGVSPVASLEEARAAFKRLAMLYHPDRYGDSAETVKAEAEAKMRELNAAFAELVARRRGGPEPEEILASEKWLADWWDARERNRLEEEERKIRFQKWDEIEQARLARTEAEARSIAAVWRSVYGEKREEKERTVAGVLPEGEPRPSSLSARLAEAKKAGMSVRTGTIRPQIRAVAAES